MRNARGADSRVTVRWLAVGAVLGTASCGASSEAARPVPTSAEAVTNLVDSGAAPVSIPVQPPRDPSPIVRLRLSEDDKRLVYETWQLGMSACMAQMGFDFVPVEYDLVNPEIAAPTSGPEVALYGYDLPPGSDAIVVTSNDDQVRTNDAYRSAFLGDDPDQAGGCRAVAYDRSYDETSEFALLDRQVGEAMIDISIAVEADPTKLALDATWS